MDAETILGIVNAAIAATGVAVPLVQSLYKKKLTGWVRTILYNLIVDHCRHPAVVLHPIIVI
jgi:hypothetical protein